MDSDIIGMCKALRPLIEGAIQTLAKDGKAKANRKYIVAFASFNNALKSFEKEERMFGFLKALHTQTLDIVKPTAEETNAAVDKLKNDILSTVPVLADFIIEGRWPE